METIEEIYKEILPTLSDNTLDIIGGLISKVDYDKIQKYFISWNFIKKIVKSRFKTLKIHINNFDNFVDNIYPDLNYFDYPMYISSENDFYFLRIEKRIWLWYCNHYLSDFSTIFASVREIFEGILYHIFLHNTSYFNNSPLFNIRTIESNERVVLNNVAYIVHEINENGRYKDNKLSYSELLDLQKSRNYAWFIEYHIRLATNNRYLKVEFNMDMLDILFYNYKEYWDLNDPIVAIDKKLLYYENKISENKTEHVFMLDFYLDVNLFEISNIIVFFSSEYKNHKYYFVPIRFCQIFLLKDKIYILRKKFKHYYETKSLRQQSAELIFDKLYLNSETAEEFRTNLLKVIETVNKLDFLRIADSSFFMVENFFMSEYKKYTNSSENFAKNISIDHIDNVLNIMLWRLEKYEAFKPFCKNTREYFGKLFKFFYVLKVPI